MARAFVIVVDDDDRDNAPDRPYTATVWDGNGEHMLSDESGIGASVVAALADLLHDLGPTDERLTR